jgi:hypothetical protein
MRNLLLFLLLGTLAACNRGPDQDLVSGGAAAANLPKTNYERRLLFVGGRAADPAIVAFDYTVLAGPLTIERSAGLWHSDSDSWAPLLDLSWSDQAIREPWRLVPNGPLRILVDDVGEIEALRGRGGGGWFRLSPEVRLIEWSPDDLARYQVSRGEWSLGAEKVTGLLVDIQSGSEGVNGAPPLAEMVLTDGSEFHLAISVPTNIPGSLWLGRSGRSEAMDGVLLVQDAPQEDDTWRIDAMSGRLHGEVKPLGAPLAMRRVGPAESELAQPIILQVVRGWVEVRGDRRTVFGIMRRAAE